MEHIRTPKVENVKLMDKYNPKASPTGNLYLTTSHLIFIEDKLNKETWILHMLMSSIEKPLLTTSGSQLKISCSNFQTVTFTIQRDRDAHDVYQSLLELSKPKEVQDLYCFSYNPKGELTQSTGWYFHDLQRTSIDLEKASELLQMCPKIQDNSDATELNISNGHIQFKDARG